MLNFAKNASLLYLFFVSVVCVTVKPGQAYSPQDPVNELIIQKLNLALVVDLRFISAFLHA